MPVDLQESYDLRLWNLIVHYGDFEDDLKSWRLLSKKNEVSKNMPCLQSGTPDVFLFPVASVTFADFCWLPPGGLHRMWCVHHGGSPGFHHVIPGVCALSSLGSWETFGKPTGSLAPSGLENQMAPWWMLVISVQLRPYHTIPWRKTKNWFLWDDT